MSQNFTEAGNATNLTDADSPATITGSSKIIGFLTNSTTAGTVVITTTGGDTITGTLTPAAGSFTTIKAMLPTEGVITMANTIDITLIWE